MFDFDALEEAFESLERKVSEGAELSQLEENSTDDSLSEIWPGDIPALEGQDFLGELSDLPGWDADDSDLPDLVDGQMSRIDELRVWEVVVVRCVVRREPSLDAAVAGMCSSRELLFEEPGEHPVDWVRLDGEKGFVLKDGSKKDPKLGLLVKPFHLEAVPRQHEQAVLRLLQEAWREVRQSRGFLRLPTVSKLRQLCEDAVGAASREDGSFELSSFEFEHRRGLAAVLSTQDSGFVFPPRQLLSQVTSERAWSHGRSILESSGSVLGRIDQAAAHQLLMGMKERVLPSMEDASYIISSASTLLAEQPSLVELNLPPGVTVHVIGDLHGQFWDLLHIIEICGKPSANNQYLFNGDFVDRGQFSVEVALALLAMKVSSPNCVHLNRGNHEALRMNTIYGFLQEAERKYSSKIFQLFCQAFQNLPVATVINRSVFVVHGGLSSQDGVQLKQIAQLARQREPDELADPLMLDLLWSDPMDRLGRERSPRGGGVLFGPDVTKSFCEDNGLSCIIRSHEMKQEGHEWQRLRRCLTIFSAPNYCGMCDNLGAICDVMLRPNERKITADDLHVRTFQSSPHPEEPPLMPSFGFFS
eukprot:TRINITY_DN49945_c0_g1_i1.p1 TRINITY_DN49945_c0_g1~~TRINITY_DN49945_c0_g1_i1.p1  ORF type:complete len:588 (+),score=153.98 TRINITY_DN49945_c0_g1_i1:77-1840(+)